MWGIYLDVDPMHKNIHAISYFETHIVKMSDNRVLGNTLKS